MNTNNSVDYEARRMASEALAKILTHEKVCAVRWETAMGAMSDIKRVLAYGICAIIASMVALIGFLASHSVYLR